MKYRALKDFYHEGHSFKAGGDVPDTTFEPNTYPALVDMGWIEVLASEPVAPTAVNPESPKPAKVKVKPRKK